MLSSLMVPLLRNLHYREVRRQVLSEEAVSFGNLGSSNLKRFIKALLHKDVSKRLTSIKNIERHPWFAGFDWEALKSRTMAAPLIPDTSVYDDLDGAGASERK